MILTKWLTQKIINIALANDKTEKKDFFFYCINTLLEQILFAVTILLFGLLTNKFTSCLLFLLLFTGLRLTSGGYQHDSGSRYLYNDSWSQFVTWR